ncbi:Polypeptide N-acetylgalactosaminyltransferase 3 [Thelohanellus kitauei]|uniref:Polypeptide N-acetylgalactosaminyltransferase 3 n=1 Tax=Thelohanellus kitauei TaxID=669202 RepID=A0A0C2N1L0_THEKT|nr:Polypeptide N-acetylgalactosaminyltransferase 3 [Thelohanellus kitauei]
MHNTILYKQEQIFLNNNFKRVAEVWMDDYKYFLYKNNPSIGSPKNFYLELEERKRLRQHLGCKSFRWYLQNVINDTLITAYEPDRAIGSIMNQKSRKCIGPQVKLLVPCEKATVCMN